MTIRNRLQLTGLVPIMLLFLLSSYFVVTSYLNFLKASSLKLTVQNNALLNHTLVNIGKERGLSTLYLGSKQKAFKNALEKQKIEVDQSIAYLKSNLNVENKYQFPFLPKYVKTDVFFNTLSNEVMLHTLSTLHAMRPLVDQPHINFKTLMFQHYTAQLTTPLLNYMFHIQKFSLNAEISSLILALRQLAMAEEYSGLERGFVSYFLLKKQPMSVEDIVLWHQLQNKANIFDITQIINTPLREKLENILSTPKTVQHLHTLAVLSEIIQQNTHDGVYKEESIQWFTQQSHKITLLSKMQVLISNTLWHKSTLYLEKYLLILSIALLLWLLSFILAYLHYKTTREISLRRKKSTHEKKSNSNTPTQTSPVDTSLLLAHASHNIRTPLHGMLGFIKLLGSTDLDKEQRDLLSVIDKSSSNLLETMNSYLHSERFKTDKETLKNHTFHPQTLFENAIETYTVMAAEKDIDLHFYMDPKIPTALQSDPVKLTSILTNLISNAIQYTPKGGEVNVEIVQTARKKNIHTLRFVIQDTGIGITGKAQKNIFKPFTQVNAHSNKTAQQNSGLGLSIAYKLVEQLGGLLTLHSEKDKGSTFFFIVEIENPSATQASQKDFRSYHFAQCKQTTTTFDSYMKKYMDYYPTKVSYFQTLSELESLEKEGQTQHYWIDSDHCTEEILEALPSIDPSKVILLATIHNREKLKAFGIDTNHIIYKPLTLTKIQKILQPTEEEIINPTPQENTGILPSFTQFHAHVLITEDNTINLKLMQRMLHMHGITTDTANDGLEALKKRKKNSYDMIFMDIHMPGIDGIETTGFIRQYEQNKDIAAIPIVALTANTIEANKDRFIQDGFNEYIAKPIDTTELLRILHLFLKEKPIEEPQQQKAKTEKSPEEKAVVEAVAVEIPTKSSHKRTSTAQKEVHIDTTKEEALPIPIVPSKTNTITEELPREEESPQVIENDTETTTDTVEKTADETVEKIVESVPETELTTEKQTKQILIAKRFLLEEKIVIKVLESLDYPYQILKKEASLKDALESYRYDIVFTDSHFINEEIEAYADIIHIITTQQSKEEIKKLIAAYRG